VFSTKRIQACGELVTGELNFFHMARIRFRNLGISPPYLKKNFISPKQNYAKNSLVFLWTRFCSTVISA